MEAAAPECRRKEGQCEHKRQRSQCKECGGAGVCQQVRRRIRCKECGGEVICQHNRIGSTCRECGGGRSASTIGKEAGANRA